MKIFEGDQYDPAWWALRRGVPTASEFGRIMTPRKLQYASAAQGYICQLIAERLDPYYPRLTEYASPAMQHGTKQEAESRKWYELDCNMDVKQVKFCLSDCGRFGASPDGLVGEEGVLELKNPQPATHVAYLLAGGDIPDEYLCQVHGHLIVTGRKWVDFVSYSVGRPLVVREEANEFTEQLKKCLELFWDQYQGAMAKLGLEPIVKAA